MLNTQPLARLYSLAEIEDAGYCSRRTSMQNIKDRKIPAVKVGNTYKIFASDLPALLTLAGSLTDESKDVLLERVTK